MEFPGIRAGHATDPVGETGCTVFLFDRPLACGMAAAGQGQSTRQTDALRCPPGEAPVDGVLLAGGSTFGLGASDGALRLLRERGRGIVTPYGQVPRLPSAVIFDLGIGRPDAFPTAEDGYRAAAGATADFLFAGRLGAGAGASCGKLLTTRRATRSGLGHATLDLPGAGRFDAFAVVNPFGNVIDSDGRTIAGCREESGGFVDIESVLCGGATGPGGMFEHARGTILLLLVTDAALPAGCLPSAAAQVLGTLASVVRPAFTPYDGDLALAVSTAAGGQAHPLQAMAAWSVAVRQAVWNSVRVADDGRSVTAGRVS